MNVTLRQLRAFLAVHQEGSFTKAAETLHITQSALSSIIKELENNLELGLFDRSTRKLETSEAGRNILPAVIRMLDEMDTLTNEVKGLKELDYGKVRIAVAQQLASVELPRIISMYNTMYPQVEVSMIDCGVEKIQDIVSSGEADIGIGPERKLQTSLSKRLIFSQPFHLATLPSHPIAQGGRIRWKDIASLELITLRGTFTDLLIENLMRDSADYIIKPKHQVNFMSTALSMVKNGLGVTLCLPYAFESVKQNELVMVPICDPIIYRNFYLYSSKNREKLPAVQKFIDVYLKHMHFDRALE
ncbi:MULTISPECIES: LysR family transcriptional regulator [Marinomonas]|uniref:LysR family transcriptional regulator n=2 Tax=Marinomonas TaxID=28253 RepID=A0A368ZVV0_9GAMM|nr:MULTISPECIES: LysR family transcriptional regulator [Marinomonas]MBR7889859.1 LysR family transcriptional regulator [Marinomonas vulgaris]RCW98298.1 LysR family transcriptional regulator [Marinomonas foliarum]|tara:strand:- start:7370 stop:8275 length:906 start_codon:yes stop_codon:yes gene_type:complete